jgi:hypothetical protein
LIVLFGVVWVGHRSGRGGVEVALASVDQEFNACWGFQVQCDQYHLP